MYVHMYLFCASMYVHRSSQDSPLLSLQLPRVESTVTHTSSLSHPHQSAPSSMHFNGPSVPSGPQEHVVQRLREEDRDLEQRVHFYI